MRSDRAGALGVVVLGRVLGVRVLFDQGKMPEHEPNFGTELLQDPLELRIGPAAERALEIAVLDERHASVGGSERMIAATDRGGEGGAGGGHRPLPGPLERGAVPVPEIRGGLVRRLHEGEYGLVGGGGAAHHVVRQDELA